MSLALYIAVMPFSYGAVYQFEEFARSLQEDIFLQAERILKVAEDVKVSKPGIFDRMGTGAAYYKPFTNTIVLHEDNLIRTRNGRLRIKNTKEMNGNGNVNYFSTRAETIFHEISHGELDVLIENDNTSELNYLLFRTIGSWFKKNFRRINSKTAAHEFYGYTAGNLVATLYLERESILLRYGIRPKDLSCFSKKALVKIAKRENLKEEFYFKASAIKNYYTAITPDYIFIRGKEFKIKDRGFKDAWKKSIFNHLQNEYQIPGNTDEFVRYMNNSKYIQALRTCYQSIISEI